MLKLQFRDRRQEAVWLVDSRFTIGSDAANSLMVSDANLKPQHAEIENRQDRLIIRDIAANGDVFVNGQVVKHEITIGANDILTIGQVEFEIVDPKRHVQHYENKLKALHSDHWKLVSNASWLEQKTFQITQSMIIGRDRANDICLPLDHLSRQHVQLDLQGKRLFVRDLNSSNGTYVNGERITEAELRAGDKLKLDVVTFDIEAPQAADPNRTIIRSAEPGNAKASKNRTIPAAKQATAPARTDKKAPKPKQAAKKQALVADGKQAWIKNEPIVQERNKAKTVLIIVAASGLIMACAFAALAL